MVKLAKALPVIARSIEHQRLVRSLGVVRKREIAGVALLSMLVVFLEAVGLGMFYPVFQFAEAKADAAAFIAASSINAHIARIFDYFSLPLSLLALCIVSFAFILLRQIANYFLTVRQEEVKLRIGRRISIKCFSAILSSNSRYIRELKSSEFATLCDHESQAASSIVRIYIAILGQLLTIGVYGAAMVASQPVASALAVLVLVGISAPMSMFTKVSRRASADMMTYRRYFTQFLTERYRAWKLIKLANALPREVDHVGRIANQSIRKQVYLFHLAGLMRLLFGSGIFLFVLGVIYYTVEILRTDIGAIALFILILMRLQPIAQQFNGQLNSLALYDPALHRVHEMWLRGSQQKENSGTAAVPPALTHGIEFDRVHFTYPASSRAALEDIELHIPAGVTAAIVGRSGAGKSTLVDLLPRFIEPDSGSVYLDGRPLGGYRLDELRRSIAYVPQEPFIFVGTIGDNIRYSRTEATDEEVREAARLAHADEFIDPLPDGYDTLLGEDGARLSGGQKQRIALARAFLAKPLILILDEPTSALDYGTDENIRQAIKAFVSRSHITAMIVAHRLSTVRDVDLVIHVEAGRIVKIGRPDEVLPGLSVEELSSEIA